MSIRDSFFFVIGIGFLALAKAKNILLDYSPKAISMSEIARCIQYDINIAERWLNQLQVYTHSDNFLHGKNVLELGPGSDLGIGIYLLSKGCYQYSIEHAPSRGADNFRHVKRIRNRSSRL
jgi:hypothetical protein